MRLILIYALYFSPFESHLMQAHLATQTFPLVWMHAYLASEENASPLTAQAEMLHIFEELLARETPFVFLSQIDHTAGQTESQEERKRITLWMKAHKAPLRKYVNAMIQIEPDPIKRLTLVTFSAIFPKFWGFPLLIVSTRDEALSLATQRLCNTPERTALAK